MWIVIMEKAKKIRIDTTKNKKSDWLISWGLGEKKVGNKTSTQNPSNQAGEGGRESKQWCL